MLNVHALRRCSLTLLPCLVMAGCGERAEAPPAGGLRPPHPVRELAAELIVESPADSLLTDVTALDVDSRGNMYVADWLLKHVVVLSPEGQVLRAIGREGSGPGEFRRVSSVQVVAGDTLMVYDRALQRVSVFAPGGTRFNYLGNLRPGPGMTALAVARVPGSKDLLATYSRPFASWDSRDDKQRSKVLRLLKSDGSVVADTLLEIPFGDALVKRVWGGLTVGVHPFGRGGITRVTADGRVAQAWNDTLGVAFYSVQGQRVGGFALPARGAPVSEAEMQALEKGISPDLLPALRDARPRSWPVLRTMLIDDAGRLWFGLNSERGPRAEWATYDESGRYLGSVFLPGTVTLYAIRGALAYGVAVDELDVPRIVVYRIPEITDR